MPMAIPILSEIERLINEHGSAAVLKEHLSLLNTKLGLLREDIEHLQEENADLVRQNAELKKQLSGQEERDEFVESHGALFEPLAGGGYSETPRCPVCLRTMWCFAHAFPYECSDDRCGHKANFKGSQLQQVIEALPDSPR